MPVTFIDRSGETSIGRIIYAYSAFEGGMRYVVSANNREYRCTKDTEGNYVEYVA